jgi:hypothetical protein
MQRSYDWPLWHSSSAFRKPNITFWSSDEASLEIIEACAGLIDRLAKRIEDTIGDPPADRLPTIP